jgi:hypothetical protein
MDDYRRWNTDSGYFAGKNSSYLFVKMIIIFTDDEDTSDDQEEIKLSSTRKSHLTINEHERFTKEKDEFKRKYKEQIDQVKRFEFDSFSNLFMILFLVEISLG